LIGCRGAAPLLVPPEDVPAIGGLLTASLSSSLDDSLGFGLLVGRWGDESESEDASIFTWAAGEGVGLETVLFDVGPPSTLFSTCFDGPGGLGRNLLTIFLSTGSSASDSVVESGSIRFT